MTIFPVSAALPQQSRSPSIELPTAGRQQTTSEFELDNRLDERRQMIRRRSFLRHSLIHTLSTVALVSLEMANRLDK
jgi:hypothetical protein